MVWWWFERGSFDEQFQNVLHRFDIKLIGRVGTFTTWEKIVDQQKKLVRCMHMSIFKILHLVMLIFTSYGILWVPRFGYIHTWRILTFSTISLLGGDHCLQQSRGFLDGILMIAWFIERAFQEQKFGFFSRLKFWTFLPLFPRVCHKNRSTIWYILRCSAPNDTKYLLWIRGWIFFNLGIWSGHMFILEKLWGAICEAETVQMRYTGILIIWQFY